MHLKLSELVHYDKMTCELKLMLTLFLQFLCVSIFSRQLGIAALFPW